MQSYDLEDLTLLLIRDASAPDMWIDRWAYSYPTVKMVSITDDLTASLKKMKQIMDDAVVGQVAVVAHGMGVWAWIAWAYEADINALGKVKNLILVSPPDIRSKPYYREQWLNVPSPCKTALVVASENEECSTNFAKSLSNGWQARLLTAPQTGKLNAPLQGWQWGMKLMQEMLLS